MTINGKKACLECKIRVASRRKSEFIKQPSNGLTQSEQDNPMLKLNSGPSQGKERGTSKPLGSFRKTATLKVDKSGQISGWDALWD